MSLGINIDLEEKQLNNPNHIDLIFSLYPYGDTSIIKDSLFLLEKELELSQNNINFSNLRNFIINSGNLSQMDYNKEKINLFNLLEDDILEYKKSLELIIRKVINNTVNSEKEKEFLLDFIKLDKIINEFEERENIISEKIKTSLIDENLYLNNLEMYVKSIKPDIISYMTYSFEQLKKSLNVQEKIKARIDIKNSIDNMEISYLDYKEVIFGEINFSDYKKLIDLKINEWIKKELGESLSYLQTLKTSPFSKGKEFIIKEMSVKEFLDEYKKINNIWNEYFERNELQEKILSKIKIFNSIKQIYYNDLNILRKKIEDKLIEIDDEFKKVEIDNMSSKEILQASYLYNLGFFLSMEIKKELENITSEILSGESNIISKNIPFFLAQKMNKSIADKLKKSLIIKMSQDLEYNFSKQYNKKSILSEKEIANKLIKNIDFTHEYNLFFINQDQDEYKAKVFEKKLKKLHNKKTMALLFRDIEIDGNSFNIDCVFDKKSFYHKDMKSLR